jgi:ATP-dependent DNA helicase RecQ
VTEDSTEQARQFLSCIARLGQRGERYGAAYVIEILRGARTQRLIDRGHDNLSVYGIGKSRSVDDWRSLARSLLHQRLIEQTQDGFSVLSLNELSWQILRGERSVVMAKAVVATRPRTRSSAAAASAAHSTAANGARIAEGGEALFERLRVLRKQLADAQGLPPYVIFHDATLREMVVQRPQTLSEFAGIRGVGEGKLARYGQQFIAALLE